MKTKRNLGMQHEEFGSGPAILFLLSEAARAGEKELFQRLAGAGFRVLVATFATQGKTSAADYARDTAALLNHLGIGRAVTLGVGQGGAVLMEMLALFPARVAAYSLVVDRETTRALRKRAGGTGFAAAVREGRLDALKDALMATLSGKDDAEIFTRVLPHLQAWVDQMENRTLSTSGEEGTTARLAGTEIPPLMGAGRLNLSKDSIAARGWRRIRGLNAPLAALFQVLASSEEDQDEEEEVLPGMH